jgi:hypothetical protein
LGTVGSSSRGRDSKGEDVGDFTEGASILGDRLAIVRGRTVPKVSPSEVLTWR